MRLATDEAEDIHLRLGGLDFPGDDSGPEPARPSGVCVVSSAAGGRLAVTSSTRFFRAWTHRSPDSIFGPASSPVIRNGAFLCFDSEEKAQAECDRLNAQRSDMLVRYSVEPTHIEALLPHRTTKRSPAEAPSFSALATVPCLASNRQARAPRSA